MVYLDNLVAFALAMWMSWLLFGLLKGVVHARKNGESVFSGEPAGSQAVILIFLVLALIALLLAVAFGMVNPSEFTR